MRTVLPAILAVLMGLPVPVAAASPTTSLLRSDASVQRSSLILAAADEDDDDRKPKRRRGRDDDDARDERRAYRQGVRDGRHEAREGQFYQPGFRDRGEYRRYGRGQYLPREYRTYVVNDYNRFGYPPPPRGYQYVRVGQDTYLTQIATGLILNAFLGGG